MKGLKISTTAAGILLLFFCTKPENTIQKINRDEIRKLKLLPGQITIGDREEAPAFYFIKDIVVDTKGNIILIDHKYPTPLLYGPSGKFLGKIGRRGSGPGEFLQPERICITGMDIYVYDQKHFGICQFNSDYQYQKLIKLNKLFHALYVNTDGRIFSFIHESHPGKNTLYDSLIQFQKQDGTIRMIHRFISDHWKKKGSKGGRVMGKTEYRHTPRFGFCGIDEQRFCYGYSSEDQLYIYDTRTDTQTNFDVVFTTRPLTPKQQKYYREQESDPSLRPKMQTIFNKIMADEQGTLYVFHPRPVDDFWGPVTVDIYSPAGEYRGTVQFPHDPLLIHGGRMFYLDLHSSDKFLLKIQEFIMEEA